MQTSLCLDYFVEESLDFIRDNEPPEGYFVGFSGGKDSIVTFDLCRKAGVKFEAYTGITGIDPPRRYSLYPQELPGREIHKAQS